MNVTDISCGYDRMNGQRLGQIEATFQTGRDIFGVTFFSLTRKLLMQMRMPGMHRKYWGAGILIIPGASIQLHLPSIFVIM
mgnify:CR=1 FL=1